MPPRRERDMKLLERMCINQQNRAREIIKLSRKLGIGVGDNVKPRELERRLANAFNSGFFDGYHEGVDDTHKIWTTVVPAVPGIGDKRWQAIMKCVEAEMLRRQTEKELLKSPTLTSVLKEAGVDLTAGEGSV